MDEQPTGHETDEAAPAGNGAHLDAADLVRAAPTLARFAAAAGLRTASWTMSRSFRAGNRLARAALAGESVSALVEDAVSDLRSEARRVLGVSEPGSEPRASPPPPEDTTGARPTPKRSTLAERGAELLSRSADLAVEDGTHPAYERILGQLAPDEARVLRLLSTESSQPAVDVRTWRPLGIGSQLVEPGLSMIARHAGCRYPDRLHAYLNNLFRLGLVWFSREPVEDPGRYQVLEAQPEVIEAMERAGRAQTVRRSIGLTAFGEDFCRTCLPHDTDEIEALAGDELEI